MQLRDEEGAEKSGGHPADGDFVRDDKMLEVNEGGGNETAEQKAVGQDQPG